MAACLVVVVSAALAGCAGEEELHSSPPCPEGLHQECVGDEDSVRCKCVSDAAEGGSGGFDAGDAGAE